jgi:hypothetical protein
MLPNHDHAVTTDQEGKPDCSGLPSALPPDAAPADPPPETILQEWERRCIGTGAIRPRKELIRCVIGPDGTVCPDIDEKLPGRGLWVSCDGKILAEAIRKNMFSKAARELAPCPPDLAERIHNLLRDRVLQFIGLAQRSGNCITGFSQVEPAAKAGEIAVLFIASDAGHDGAAKLKNRLDTDKIYRFLTSLELGRALGHDQLVYVGLRPHPLTHKIIAAATRFSAFAPQENVASEAGMAQIAP